MSDSETTRPSATTGSPPAGARSRSGSRAMVVEDKTGLAAVVGSYLERDGFDVTLVHDGADAVITARKVDTLIGLSVGADDYVTKPFSPRELIARVGRDVWLAGEPVALTRTEFDLLAALSERLRTASAGASSSTMPGEAWVGDEHLVDVGSGRC